jgi:hypothetical protein
MLIIERQFLRRYLDYLPRVLTTIGDARPCMSFAEDIGRVMREID